jgi:hypothetical protein
MPMSQSTYGDYWRDKVEEYWIVCLHDPIDSNLPGHELLKHRCVEKYMGDPAGPEVVVTLKRSIGEHPGCEPILFVKVSNLPQYPPKVFWCERLWEYSRIQ